MKKKYLLLSLLINTTIAFSQLSFCTGSKGSPIFFEDFGSGLTYGPFLPTGVTTYLFVNNGFPQDGEYTLFHRTDLIPNTQNWHYSLDHTPDTQPNGLDGKCLIVNASNTPGQFYKRTVTGLCSNTTFEFSAWLMNIYNSASGTCPGTGIPINVTFEIWNANETIQLISGNTGNINGATSPIWNPFGLVFTMATGQTSVILKMRNNGVGGCGNDLAIDDIMFRACGEFSTITNTGNAQNTINICQNETIINNVLNISTSGTVLNVYQWQQSNDGTNYSDINGETNTNYTMPSVNITTYYRVKIAKDIFNLSNPFCATLSTIFTVNVNPLPNPPSSNGDKTLCGNQLTSLTVTAGLNDGVNWYNVATNGNILQSNSLSYSPTSAGIYYAESFKTVSGCKSSSRTAVTLLPKITVSYSGITGICSTETTAIALNSSDVNAVLNWTATSTNVTGFSNGTGTTIQQTLTLTGTSAGTVNYRVTPIVNGCTGIPAIIIVTVGTPTNITPIFNAIATSFCLNTTAPILPISSTNSSPIMGTWNPPIINTTAIGTTIYTFTPQLKACTIYAPYSKTVSVGNNLIPDFISTITLCSGTIPPLLNLAAPNGITGTWNPATIDNLVSKSYLFTPNANQCAAPQIISVTINSNNSTVLFTGITALCSTATTALTLTPSDLNATINWTATSSNVTGFSNGTGSTIQQTLTLTGNTTGTVIYTVTPIISNCGGSPTTITVTVNTQTDITPTFNALSTSFCLNDTAPILPTSSTNSTAITGTWNPATINTALIGSTVYTFIPQPNNCLNYAAYTLTITISDNFLPDFDDGISFCLGAIPPLLNPISPVGISGTWNPTTIDNQVDGSYLFTPDANQCAFAQTINVTVFKPTLTSVTYTTTLAFDENQIITVLALENGDYLYQLDAGIFQTNNVFSNVASGFHTITVMDKNGCSPSLSENITIINYPKFFTPNGDGVNDIWTITSVNNLKDVEIALFDRYGKVVKQILPNNAGWDGNFNGIALPADDYWFVIDFVENNIARTFRSHFSLKR
jgi:gliding motility-associated-like protein